MQSVALTDRRATFAAHVAQGVGQTDAARIAGYQHPKQEAFRLTRDPHVARAIDAEQKRIARFDIAPKAWARLSQLLDSTNENVALGAVKVALTQCRELLATDPDSGKALAEMTSAELEGLVTKLEARRMAEAIDVTPEPSNQPAPKPRKPRYSAKAAKARLAAEAEGDTET